MTPGARRTAGRAACAAAALALIASAAASAPAAAAPREAVGAPYGAAVPRAANGCPGVLVVVEFRDVPQGGGSRTGCASNPSSGISALRQAGFGVTLGTGPYSGGFVCALDGAPARGCGVVDNDTYWSYWWMAPGTSRWVYSQTGAAGRRPQRGGIEAWVWQSSGSVEAPGPRSAVAAPAEPAPRPVSGTTTRPSTGRSTTPRQGTPSRSSDIRPAGGNAAAAGSSTTTTGAAPGTGAAPPTTDGTAPTTQGTDRALAAPPASGNTADSERQGWPWWTGLIGAVVAVALGADTVRRVRRPSGSAR
ncbi:MAG: hypothetical protein HY830_20045 [Actinobacteria bacterium]|nr:hypothetical protein [Actinomycetota bacterium]